MKKEEVKQSEMKEVKPLTTGTKRKFNITSLNLADIIN